jgi:hypothetical protein
MSIEIFGSETKPRAIVIRGTHKIENVNFPTPTEFPLQLGLMLRPAGYEVKAHIHNQILRSIEGTQEFLLIRKGECTVSLYDETNINDIKISLVANDAILLAYGGHSIFMNSECEILEIKQGPYDQENDKSFIDGGNS